MPDTDLEDEDLNTGLYVFGCNLLEIKCMRTSLLSGYIGGFVGVIAGVWWRNKFAFAMHSGFAGFCTFASLSWIKCRYQSSNKVTGLKSIASERLKLVGGNKYILPSGLLKVRKLDNLETVGDLENQSM